MNCQRFAFATMKVLLPVLALATIPMVGGCSRSGTSESSSNRRWRPPKDLAAWGLFKTEGSKLIHEPAEGTVPYDLTTPLFSDYTSKYRFVRLPKGSKAVYSDTEVMDFPVETVIAKTFSYPHDRRDPSKGEKIIETRILYRRPSGWEAFAYQWNDEQTGAELSIAGDVVPSTWIDTDGTTKSNDYIIPDANKCVSCHDGGKKIIPIGPKARHLNRDYEYSDGNENQLVHWSRIGLLEGAPSNPDQAPRNAVWDNPHSGTLDERARAYLEINCAHCHHKGGPARNAGLDFRIAEADTEKLGIWKSPAAVGQGGGGRRYSIVPGKPDESILIYRVNSTKPGTMMPEVARRMIHTEGVALLREWIQSLPDPHKTAEASNGG